jgi:glycosyltransferase involved in cell wall biosynthesis
VRAARAARVLVSPRVRGSNTPLKIYEQLASGVPLVATRIGSHTQVLDDSVCFLVEPSAEGLAAGIARALHEPEEAARRSLAARERYAKHYSRPVYEGKLARVLELVR